MGLILDLTLFLVLAIILAKSSLWVVNSLVNLSAFLKISEFSAGFIILSIATSLPELFVGINSALLGRPNLSLGNVIGSNIADIALILGIAILISGSINVKSKIIRKDSIYIFLIALAPILLMLDGILSRFDGFILILIFIYYIIKRLKDRKKFDKPVNNIKTKSIFNDVLFFILSIVLLILSANLLVKFAIAIATDLNVAAILIGLFLVAIGTSLPELSLTIRSVLTKHKSIALGDNMGAVAVNSSLVLGVTSLIEPIRANFTLFLISALFMILVVGLYTIFVVFDKKLTLKQGVILIFLYIAFVIIELSIKR
ncbi:sodium:calcium antiporter [Candidatus Woesearchaeota archaeon]|nr:sodium:calcium antiporter [Candidatus Woesearchaeota archaeon]